MKSSQYLGPTLALIAVAVAAAAGLAFDAHVAGWVFAVSAVALSVARVCVPEARERGLAVRSAPVDITVLLLSAAVLIFLAQTAPDLY